MKIVKRETCFFYVLQSVNATAIESKAGAWHAKYARDYRQVFLKLGRGTEWLL